MFKYFPIITLILLYSCNSSKKEKVKPEIKNVASHSAKESISEDIGIVKWIRDDRPDIKTLAFAVSKFMSESHVPLDSSLGDINSDGENDLVFVTKVHNEEDYLLDTAIVKRELLILLAQDNNAFKLANRSEIAIPCINCYGMSDAFAGIKAGTGQFTILFYGGSNWKDTRASTFKFDKNKQEWYLDNEIEEHFFMNWQNYQMDTLTKKDFGIVPISNFNIYKIYDIN